MHLRAVASKTSHRSAQMMKPLELRIVEASLYKRVNNSNRFPWIYTLFFVAHWRMVHHTGSRYNLPMQPSFDEVEKLARALPEDQRVRLANSLYESVSDEEQASEAEIEAAWGDEIKRRLDEIDSGAVELIPGEEVMGRMLKSLSPEARARLRK